MEFKDFRYYNACQEPCDTMEGPCSCGAFHKKGEFEIKEDILYRYGKPMIRRTRIYMNYYLDRSAQQPSRIWIDDKYLDDGEE